MITDTMVFVVDDDSSVQETVARLIRSHGLRAETFSTAAEFLTYAPTQLPSCLILGIEPPGSDGWELQSKLADRGSVLPIIFVSNHGDIPMSVRAIKSGAVDFLPKPFKDDALMSAVREAITKAEHDLDNWLDLYYTRGRFETLTPREREVLEHVTSGAINKQIGRRLGVAEKTVKVHRGRVMRKMEAGSIAELVRMAHRLGISSIPRKCPNN